MAPGVEATFAMTAPVLSSSLLYLQMSSSFNSSSNALLVPEPDSRPTTTIGASLPPTSFQLVTFPSYISDNCCLVSSPTVLAGSTTTAIPSIATMFSATPLAFSSSFKFLEELPISAVPPKTASTPAPEPTNSAVTVTSGYFSIKDSLSALANFSMEVEPTMLMDPLKSAAAPEPSSADVPAASLVPAGAPVVAAAPSAVVGAAVACSPAELLHPASIPITSIAQPISAIIFLLFIFIILCLRFFCEFQILCHLCIFFFVFPFTFWSIQKFYIC